MKKALLLIGKGLVAFSLLWPVPFGFVLYPWFGYKIDMPMWGVKAGYWWPLLGVLALGIIMCTIASYKSRIIDGQLPYSRTPIAYLMKATLWSLAIIGGLILLALTIIAIYHLFFTSLIEISVPVGACIGVVGYLIYLWGLSCNNRK